MYRNISWPPLNHLTECTCSPCGSKSHPSMADPPPNFKGGTVTFLRMRQFMLDEMKRKGKRRKEQIFALLIIVFFEWLAQLLQWNWQMGLVHSSSREGRIETVRRNQPEVVTTDYSVTDSLTRYKWGGNMKWFKSKCLETLCYILKKSNKRSNGS